MADEKAEGVSVVCLCALPLSLLPGVACLSMRSVRGDYLMCVCIKCARGCAYMGVCVRACVRVLGYVRLRRPKGRVTSTWAEVSAYCII